MQVVIQFIIRGLIQLLIVIAAFFGVEFSSSDFFAEKKVSVKEVVVPQNILEENSGTKKISVDFSEQIEGVIGEIIKIEPIAKDFSQEMTKIVIDSDATDKKVIQNKQDQQNLQPDAVISDPIQIQIPQNINNSIIHLICARGGGAAVSISSGSGVIVRSDGLILTNAHVAYPFLSQYESGVDCIAQLTAIPNAEFDVEVVYIPQVWINESSALLALPNPIHSGEHDFAFLKIVDHDSDQFLAPNRYPSLNIELSDASYAIGNDVLVGGYPYVSTGIFNTDTNPLLRTAVTYIRESLSFNGANNEAFATGIVDGVAKLGSSGGPVIDNGNVIGIIVSTNALNGGTYINALSTKYIDSELINQVGKGLNQFISSI